MVQLDKYFDFSLYSRQFSLLSLTSLLSAPEREVTSPSDFKVVGALYSGFKFRITAVLNVETDIITSIGVSLIGRAVIRVILS